MIAEEKIYDLYAFFEVIARQPLAIWHSIDYESPEILNLSEFFDDIANHTLQKSEELSIEAIREIAENLYIIPLFLLAIKKKVPRET